MPAVNLKRKRQNINQLLKESLNCPAPAVLHARMMREVDFKPIVSTLLKDGTVKSDDEARERIIAFSQWFSVGVTTKTTTFVMMNGIVDDVFHAMILNSKWYFNFCYSP